MKISIVYTSQTGTTEAAAEYIEDGILAKYPFIQVKMMNIRENEVDLDFLAASEAVILGSPVYFTSMSWELKRWFDQSFRIDLSGKLGAAFVTCNSVAGGTDTAIMEILRHMLMKGMYIFSGNGKKSGTPFQVGAIGLSRELDTYAEQMENFGETVAEHAIKLFQK